MSFFFIFISHKEFFLSAEPRFVKHGFKIHQVIKYNVINSLRKPLQTPHIVEITMGPQVPCPLRLPQSRRAVHNKRFRTRRARSDLG